MPKRLTAKRGRLLGSLEVLGQRALRRIQSWGPGPCEMLQREVRLRVGIHLETEAQPASQEERSTRLTLPGAASFLREAEWERPGCWRRRLRNGIRTGQFWKLPEQEVFL